MNGFLITKLNMTKYSLKIASIPLTLTHKNLKITHYCEVVAKIDMKIDMSQ